MNIKIFSATFFLLILHSIRLYSQCSDAGVCIIGKDHGDMDEIHSSFSFGYSFGTSGKDADVKGQLNDLTFSTLKVEGNFGFNDFQAGFFLPYIFISGPLGNNQNIGDLSILINKIFQIDEIQNFILSVGGKFATGKVNLSSGEENPLPQRYQPGLGTNDFLAGINYNYDNFNASIAYQKPFGRSKNSLTRLKRGDDILFRVGYNQTLNNINLKGELLSIFRLQPSSILDTTKLTESFIEIDGSNETQLNFLATITYNIWNNINLQMQIGVPLLKRDYNYDGLKRSFTISTAISYNFNL